MDKKRLMEIALEYQSERGWGGLTEGVYWEFWSEVVERYVEPLHLCADYTRHLEKQVELLTETLDVATAALNRANQEVQDLKQEIETHCEYWGFE